MDIVSFSAPLDQAFAQDGLEADLLAAFKAVLAEQIRPDLQDLVDYGCPHIGSSTVVERFSKKDGLVVLRNAEASDVLMRIIYATWLSLGSERGLNFLEFVLTMLWADKWKLIRLWHSISKVQAYPRFLSDVRKKDYFLTSRVNLEISEDVSLSEIVELSPSVRKLVPANVVLKVIALSLNTDLGNSNIGVACVAKPMNFIRIGVDYDRYVGFGLPYAFAVNRVDDVVIISWAQNDDVLGFKLYRCEESMANLDLNSLSARVFDQDSFTANFLQYHMNYSAQSLAISNQFSLDLPSISIQDNAVLVQAYVQLTKGFNGTRYSFAHTTDFSSTVQDIVSVIVNRWQAAKFYDFIDFVGVNAFKAFMDSDYYFSSDGVVYKHITNENYYAFFYEINGNIYSYQSFEEAVQTYYNTVLLANKTENDDYGKFLSATHSCGVSDAQCTVTLSYLSAADETITQSIEVLVNCVPNSGYYQYWYQFGGVNYSFVSFEDAAKTYYNTVLLANKTENDDYGKFLSATHSCGVSDENCSLTINYESSNQPTEPTEPVVTKSLTLVFDCVENSNYDPNPIIYKQVEVAQQEVSDYIERLVLGNPASSETVDLIKSACMGDAMYGNNDFAIFFAQQLLDAMQARTAMITPKPILMRSTTEKSLRDDFYLDEGQHYYYRLSAFSATKEKLNSSEVSIST